MRVLRLEPLARCQNQVSDNWQQSESS